MWLGALSLHYRKLLAILVAILVLGGGCQRHTARRATKPALRPRWSPSQGQSPVPGSQPTNAAESADPSPQAQCAGARPSPTTST